MVLRSDLLRKILDGWYLNDSGQAERLGSTMCSVAYPWCFWMFQSQSWLAAPVSNCTWDSQTPMPVNKLNVKKLSSFLSLRSNWSSVLFIYVSKMRVGGQCYQGMVSSPKGKAPKCMYSLQRHILSKRNVGQLAMSVCLLACRCCPGCLISPECMEGSSQTFLRKYFLFDQWTGLFIKILLQLKHVLLGLGRVNSVHFLTLLCGGFCSPTYPRE